MTIVLFSGELSIYHILAKEHRGTRKTDHPNLLNERTRPALVAAARGDEEGRFRRAHRLAPRRPLGPVRLRHTLHHPDRRHPDRSRLRGSARSRSHRGGARRKRNRMVGPGARLGNGHPSIAPFLRRAGHRPLERSPRRARRRHRPLGHGARPGRRRALGNI